MSGLDVGWGRQLDLALDPATRRYTLEQPLPTGVFPYKFVVDGRWTVSADRPMMMNGDNLNNYVCVVGDTSDPGVNAARARLLSEECPLTPSEQERLRRHFGLSS